jgi:hypothetical protein
MTSTFFCKHHKKVFLRGISWIYILLGCKLCVMWLPIVLAVMGSIWSFCIGNGELGTPVGESICCDEEV